MSRPRRRAASRVSAVLVAVLALATGCATFNKAFGQEEAVVQFQPNTAKAIRLHVRSTCSHIPQITVEPLPTTNLYSAQVYDVRYEVGGASDAHIAELQVCLQKFPSVLGVTFNTPGGG